MSDVWANRQIDDYQRLCEALVAEQHRLRKALENVAIALEAPPMTEEGEAISIVIREILKVDLSLALSRPQLGSGK